MKSTSSLFAFVITGCFALTTSFAQDDLASKIREVTQPHEKALSEFNTKIRSAKPEDRRKIYQAEYPDSTETVAELQKLIAANPKEPAILNAAQWVLRFSRRDLAPESYQILEGHLNDEKMAEVVSMMNRRSPASIQFLKTASESSTIDQVRGTALFTLGASMERDPSKRDEFIAAFEKLIKEHPDLKIRGRNVSRTVKTKLFAARNLGIGKEAPEIVGKDVDGNEMKLSDYRGKVVVIDFWGDW